MPATATRPPMPIEIGTLMSKHGLCLRCGNRTGRYAWGHYRLRGLYCGCECAYLALQQYDLVALNGAIA